MDEIIDLYARERFEGYVAKFFQTIALPKELLSEELDGLKHKKNFGNLRYINQWRIDYPENIKMDIPNEHKTILSIAHKILTRGDYTTVSPFLEEKLASKFVNKGEFNPSAYELTTDSNDSTFWFDSEVYEKEFYEKVLPKILGNSFKKFVLPQVEFRSLEKNDDHEPESRGSEERVDFLITTKKSKVVVELDGEEHDNHTSKDESRTQRLRQNNYKEIRINNSDSNNLECKKIQELIKEFGTPQINKHEKGEYDKYLNSIKLAHQFQITLVELLFEGVINDTDRCNISYDFDFFLNEYAPKDIRFIIDEALSDLKQLLSKLSELYDIRFDASKLQIVENNDGCIVLTYNENIKTEMVLCIIQDISFPEKIAKELKSVENIKINKEPKTELLEYFLKYIFGFDNFLDGQSDSIKRVLLNKDTITLLPTGAGKSLIFQLATLLLPGVSVIIVPLKSLMQDQVENLERKGISRAIGLSGDIPRSEKEKVQRLLYRGQYLFIYVAPERFLIEDFRNSLRDFTKEYIVSLIVIDEAHCVSEWGHDFRPAYLTVGKNSREYCKNRDGFIPPQ